MQTSLSKQNKSFVSLLDEVFDRAGLFEDFPGFVHEEGGYTLDLEMPGVRREELEIEVVGDAVCVRGESRTRGTRRVSVTLPKDLDKETLEARLEDGVLQLTAQPKEPEPKKMIEVK